METINQNTALKKFVAKTKADKQILGFVPTMGALHRGHLSLIEQAKRECDVVIVSIFVNPTQFNNTSDFEKYPITTSSDLKMLEAIDCDAVYLPSVEAIYDSNYIAPEIDLGIYDQVMEGKFRPGHFQGVVQVVYRLFELIQPDKAYFGLKDYQQLAVIRNMVEQFHLPITIISCPTIRETDGLALSSRNMRLSSSERKEALFIYHSLISAKKLSKQMLPSELKKQIESDYASSVLKLEYFEIIHPKSFKTLEDTWVNGAIACVVAFIGEVRLIDNMVLID